MIVHEAVRMTEPVETSDGLRQDLKKRSSISISHEDALSNVASGGGVIDGAWELNAQRSGHGAKVT
jgi:hypothetical protein